MQTGEDDMLIYHKKKKNEILQKKRNRYAASKRPTLTDNQSTPSQQAWSDEISYINETDMMETCRPSGRQHESSCYASNKGKAKMSYYNLLDTDEAHWSTEQPTSFAPSKKIDLKFIQQEYFNWRHPCVQEETRYYYYRHK